MDPGDSQGKVKGSSGGVVPEPVVYSRRKVERVSEFVESEVGQLLKDSAFDGEGGRGVIGNDDNVANAKRNAESDFTLEASSQFREAFRANEIGFGGDRETESEELAKDSGKKIVKLAATEHDFRAGDLVWGKVNSYPWWPGQIIDPSSSSKKAKKYYKKDKILIAFFGDESFAWNDESRIKPFQAHFSQLEKQSNSEGFCNAVGCALEEFSRRIEFGMACLCVSEDIRAGIKTQILVNPGIREEASRRDGGDRLSTAASFNPKKLVEYVKALARFPRGGVDRLEHVVAQAQMLAFCHWKGCSQLPEFNMLGRLLENDADCRLSGDVKHADQVMKCVSDIKDDVQVPSSEGKLKTRDSSSSRKRAHISTDSMHPSKKEKKWPHLMAVKSSHVSNSEAESERIAAEKVLFSDHSSKHKAIDSMSDDSALKQMRNHLSSGIADKSPQSKRTFRVGESILRVANQLNRSAAELKSEHETSQKSVLDTKNTEKSSQSRLQSPDSSNTVTRSLITKMTIECSSLEEMLSNLRLAAQDPMEEHSFLISMIGFFSEFRDSVISDRASLRKHGEFAEQVSVGNDGEKSTKSEITETSELEYMKNSNWTDMEIQSNSEEPISLENQDLVEVLHETALESSDNLDSEKQTAGGNLDSETMNPVPTLDESSSEDFPSTALVLNFRNIDSVPSNLDEIFSHVVPENELGTEVLQKGSCAKVIFKKKHDAETAFNTVAKGRLFGSSLVSFRLRLLPYKPIKKSGKRKNRK